MENLSSASSLAIAWLIIFVVCPLFCALLCWWTGRLSAPDRSRFLPLTNCAPHQEMAGEDGEGRRQSRHRKEAAS